MNFRNWLENAENVKIIDSTQLTEEDQHVLGNAAIIRDGTLLGYHLTDDSKKVMDIFNSGKTLTGSYGKGRGRYAELGPGLYVSAVPQVWINRSTKKYDFLYNLTDEQKQKLANAIRNHQHIKGTSYTNSKGEPAVSHYLTSYEREAVERYINNWLEQDNPDALVLLAGQPYNIRFWEPDFLKPLGIEPAESPTVMEVIFTGRFADLSSRAHDFPLIASLIRQGLDGAFITGGFTQYPQLCIWRKQSIKNMRITNNSL